MEEQNKIETIAQLRKLTETPQEVIISVINGKSEGEEANSTKIIIAGRPDEINRVLLQALIQNVAFKELLIKAFITGVEIPSELAFKEVTDELLSFYKYPEAIPERIKVLSSLLNTWLESEVKFEKIEAANVVFHITKIIEHLSVCSELLTRIKKV